MKGKIIVLGFDCADLNLIKKWISEGELPNFKKIVDNGAYGKLKSSIHPVSICAWESFSTGKNPGKHGMFDYSKRKKDSYEIEILKRKEKPNLALWDILSLNDKKVAVINIPGTYPPHEVNGVIISSSIDTPSDESDYSYPKEFKKELLKNVPGYKITENVNFSRDIKGIKRYLKELYYVTEKMKDAFFYVLKNKKPDLIITVFMGLDHIQHLFWKYMDKEHPSYTEDGNVLFGNEILKMYKKMDKILGETIDSMTKEDALFVIGDHGAGPAIKNFYINNWLLENGYLILKKRMVTRINRFLNKIGFNAKDIYKIMLNLKLGKLIHIIPKHFRNKLLKRITLSFKDIDWSKSKAYSFGYYGRIFLNYKGREPEGHIEKSEYNIVRDGIIEALKKIRDPSNNKKIVTDVWKKEDIYHGEFTKEAADIVFVVGNYSYNTELHFEFGSNKIFSEHLLDRSGEHRLFGTLICYGNNIVKKEIKNAEIIDLTPTLLYYLGIPVPTDMDGKVLKEIFAKKGEVTKKDMAIEIEKRRIKDIINRIKI